MSYWSERQPPVFSAPDQRTAAIECTPPLPISQFLDAARKRDDHRTRFRALAKALPSAFDDRFDRP